MKEGAAMENIRKNLGKTRQSALHGVQTASRTGKSMREKIQNNWWSRNTVNVFQGGFSAYSAGMLVLCLGFLMHEFIYEEGEFSYLEKYIVFPLAIFIGLIVFLSTIKANNGYHYEIEALKNDLEILDDKISGFQNKIDFIGKENAGSKNSSQDTIKKNLDLDSVSLMCPSQHTEVITSYRNRKHQRLPHIMTALNQGLKDALIGFLSSATFYTITGQTQKSLTEDVLSGSTTIASVTIMTFIASVLLAAAKNDNDYQVTMLTQDGLRRRDLLLQWQEIFATKLQEFLKANNCQEIMPKEIKNLLEAPRTRPMTLLINKNQVDIQILGDECGAGVRTPLLLSGNTTIN